jgi:DNA polymerase-3 subunit alpha
MSQLDGCARIEQYVQTAAERGNPALALTDHGTMRGFFELTEQCNRHAIKPIYGVEFWVCKDMNRRGLSDGEKEEASKGENKTAQKMAVKKLEASLGIRKLYHLTVWALDNEGLRNLYRLSADSWTRGYYYKPRIDLETLCAHHKGLAVGTGCAGSVIYGNHWERNNRDLDLAISKLVDTFDDRLYLEIMPHDLQHGRQAQANEFAFHLHQLTGGRLRFLATQDAHYLGEHDAASHDVLLNINTGGNMRDDRFSFDGDQYWFKTREEMAEAFRISHGYLGEPFVEMALQGTWELAERCTAKIEINPLKCLLPPADVPAEFNGDEFAYLRDLVMKGIASRDLWSRAEALGAREGIPTEEALKRYTRRIAFELDVLQKSNFARYFLILHDLYRWVGQAGIGCGPGRGSAAGSLVSYLLGITQVDPIEHRLLFERFIAPGRINMPDIDCDFEDVRRGEIFAYLRGRYGEDRVAQISTMGSLQARQAVKDVSRVFQVPFPVANAATAAIDPTDEDGAIENALERSERFRAFAKACPDVLAHARALEGLSKSVGMHAAGIVTSPVPLSEVVPLEVRRPAGAQHLVTAFDLRGVEGIGLLKIDVLGLRTVTVLTRASKAIEAKTGESFDLLQVPLDDETTLRAFTERDFVGVFQFDSPSANAICDGMNFDCFDDIAVINAINRPGAKDFADEYKRRRREPALAERHVFHPKVTEITRDALGLMIYQEHVVKVATDVAGLTPSEADGLRKKIGKSEGHEALEKERGAFVTGCSRTTLDMDEESANRLFDAIVKFGRYGFNRSHAVCYSMLSYWTMYLKQHHPVEFYWSMMVSEKDEKKIQRLARDAEWHGIKTMLPDVNVSGQDFEIDYTLTAVRGSLMDIHGLGDAAVRGIVKAREAGRFESFVDFLKRREKSVNRKTIAALVSAGAFDSLIPNPRWLVAEFSRLWKYVEKENWEHIATELAGSAAAPAWTFDERMKEAATVNPLAMRPHPCITWEAFLKKDVRPDLSEINDELFATKQDVFCAGVITEVEERAVGDSKAYSEMPSEEVRRRIGWGQSWARLSVEGLEGKSWVKIDWRQYELFRHIVRRGVGTPIVMCAETRPDYANLHSHYIADIEEMVAKLKDGRPLTVWERLFVDHPALTYPWKTKADKKVAMSNPASLLAQGQGRFRVIGVIAHVYEVVDKRGSLMAWFGVAGVMGYIRVICFARAWEDYGSVLKDGALVGLTLAKLDDGGACLFSHPKAVTAYRESCGDVTVPTDEISHEPPPQYANEDIPF